MPIIDNVKLEPTVPRMSGDPIEPLRPSIRRLLASPPSRRAALRDELVKRIHDDAGATLEFARVCATECGTEGHDLGVDLLAGAGTLAYRAARVLLRQDGPAWANCPPTAQRNEDEVWAVLLRGMARGHSSRSEALQLLEECAGAPHRGLLVAVAEALGDLRNPEAAARLREMAGAKTDPLVREVIANALDDMES